MKIPPIISDDWPRKLISLCLALIVWFTVYAQVSHEQTYHRLPVKFENLEDIAVYTNSNVSVTVRGTSARIATLPKEKIKITGEIPDSIRENPSPGQYTVRLTKKNVDLPRGLRVIKIEPNDLKVDIDVIERREIPISRREVDLMGSIPDKFTIHTLNVTPKTVMVTGPSAFVAAIDKIVTERRIQVDENTPENFEQELKLRDIPNVSMSTNTARVYVEFARRKERKNFRDLDVLVVNRSDNKLYIKSFVGTPRLEEAVLKGPKEVVDILTASSLRPFIDISDIEDPGQYTRWINVWVSAKNCEVLKRTPEKLTFELVRRP